MSVSLIPFLMKFNVYSESLVTSQLAYILRATLGSYSAELVQLSEYAVLILHSI